MRFWSKAIIFSFAIRSFSSIAAFSNSTRNRSSSAVFSYSIRMNSSSVAFSSAMRIRCFSSSSNCCYSRSFFYASLSSCCILLLSSFWASSFDRSDRSAAYASANVSNYLAYYFYSSLSYSALAAIFWRASSVYSLSSSYFETSFTLSSPKLWTFHRSASSYSCCI